MSAIVEFRPAQPAPQTSTTNHGDGNSGIAQAQAKVDEVVVIMRANMEKVLERDEKLTDLDNRADALQSDSQQFAATATRIKRKYWWQNLKMWIILIVIIVVIIIIIIVSVVVTTQK